jgi:guanylate kinase
VPRSSKNSAENIGRGRLLVVSGPSGVGKSTVVRALIDRRDLYFSVSATTRLPRPGEQNGVDYRFLTTEEFEELRSRGELLEWATYSGHLYGTPRAPVLERLENGDDVLLDIEVQGAMQVKEAFPESITIFLAPPSMEELERRLRARGDTSDEDVERRLEIARWQTQVASERFDHLVRNDEVSEAVTEIERILDASP